jgi:hypothetical protein
MNQKLIFRVARKRFSELLCRPLGRKVIRNIKVDNTPASMLHHNEHIKHLQGSRDYSQEIARSNFLGMVLQKGSPAL